MPERLLPLLTDRPQAGDLLGEQLGVGRVTINTLAKKLQEEGVPLLITRAGYALAPGTPAPALVHASGPLGQALRYRGTVESTQDALRAWADDPLDPAPHGAVVVAERQTAGRGRRGRRWDTTGGTLVFSVLLRGEEGHPVLSLADLALLPLAAGVALHDAAGVGGLKWPNDLLAPDGRKLAGILTEADLRGEEARRVIIGIGVNVSAAPEGAAHLNEWASGLTRAAFLGLTLSHLGRWVGAAREDILREWAARSVTLGRAVSVQTRQGTLEGQAEALDAQGSLLVRSPAGERHTVSAGDVQLIGPLPESPSPDGAAPSGGPSP